MLASFFKDSAIYGLIKAITSSSHLLLLPIYTRVLSSEEYGVLDFMTITANLLYIMVSLEIAQGFARFFSDAETDKDKILYASTTLWFSLGAYSLFLIVAVNFPVELSKLISGSPKYEDLIQVAVLAIWGQGMFSLVQNQLRYELRPKQYALASLAYTAMLLAMVVILLIEFHFGVVGFFLAQLAASVTGLTVGLYFSRHSYQCVFDLKKCKKMLRFSVPLVFSSVGVFLSLYVDRIAITDLMSMEALGVYSVGYRIATVISLALVGFQIALTPLIYKNYRNESAPKEIERILRYFFALVSPLILLVTLFADNILFIMATLDYASADKVVFPLGMAFLFTNVYLFAPGIWVAKKTRRITLINLIVAGMNLALNYILIPHFGFLGAAVATCSSALIGLCLYVLMGQPLYPIPYRWTSIAVTFSILLLIGIPTMLSSGFWSFGLGGYWAIVVKLLIFVISSVGIALILLNQEKKTIYNALIKSNS